MSKVHNLKWDEEKNEYIKKLEAKIKIRDREIKELKKELGEWKELIK